MATEQMVKRELYRRSNGYCMTCGGLPDYKDGRGELHLSHIIPKSQGGKTDWENCVVECRRCHALRHNIIEV